MGFFMKKIWVTFYCCFFFRFFSKNCQKVKVTNLTKNGQNYQFFLEICFLSSLDTIWWIFYHGFVFMSFCDMRNRRHKIEIWAKKFFFNHTFYCWKMFSAIKRVVKKKFLAQISILCLRFLISQKFINTKPW